MRSSTSKPCHNCRRRRLRCDRSWPTCHKCAISGQECLGYGKVFVWTQADGQGNVKSASARESSGRLGGAGLLTPTPPELGSSGGPGEGARRGSSTLANVQLHPIRQDDAYDENNRTRHDGCDEEEQAPRAAPEHHRPPTTAFSLAADGAAIDQDTSESLAQRLLHQAGPKDTLLETLTDPVFQDLDRNSRYYLAHFADRVCKDLVARDSPSSNPFRELIPLTNKHPLLLQILIATSAIHWSNIFRPATAVPIGLTDPGGYLAQLRSQDLVSRQALIDALTAKQKALSHLRGVLDTLDPAGSEVALAAMHFFIKFDLIDLERRDGRSWQAHLEGTSTIMALLAPNNARYAASEMLRDCVIADCFIYHILGSTLASGALAARIARYALELLPVMKRAEVNSYLSCPPEILHIILLASRLSYETPSTDWTLSAADQALALIDEAIAFDIPAWADQLRQLSHVTDVDSRIHVASAHRSAACLYIVQALPLVRSVRPVDSDFLVNDILSNLAQIKSDDPYFKATSWPTFIAGAETRDGEKRTWAMTRLFSIWEICSWGYIFTAIEMLKATWQMQDAGASSGVNWLQDLKSMGFDYLIV